MRTDTKLGWHTYWITPLVVVGVFIFNVISFFKRMKPERTWTPEQKRLQILAGIRAAEDEKE